MMLPEINGQIEDIYSNQLRIFTNGNLSSNDYSVLHKIARLQYQVGMEYHWINDFSRRSYYFDLALGNTLCVFRVMLPSGAKSANGETPGVIISS